MVNIIYSFLNNKCILISSSSRWLLDGVMHLKDNSKFKNKNKKKLFSNFKSSSLLATYNPPRILILKMAKKVLFKFKLQSMCEV